MKGIKASLHLTEIFVQRVSNHGIFESQGNVCLMCKSALQQSELHAVWVHCISDVADIMLKCH